MSNIQRILAAFVAAILVLVSASSFSVAQSTGTPDQERLEAAKKLLEATGAAKQFDAAIPLFSQQLENAFIHLQPSHADEIKAVFALIPTKFAARKQELFDQIAALYAKELSLDDLHEIANFMTSPAGKRFTAAQQVLLQQSMQIGQAWGQKIGAEIDQEVRKELKERGVPI